MVFVLLVHIFHILYLCIIQQQTKAATKFYSTHKMHLVRESSNVEPRRKKKKTLEENIEECLNVVRDFVNKNSTKAETPAARLGRIVAHELADVDEDIFIDAKWKIIDILKQADLESLQRKNMCDRALSNDSSSSTEELTTFKHSNKREFSEAFRSALSVQSDDFEIDQQHNYFSSFDEEIPFTLSPTASSN